MNKDDFLNALGDGNDIKITHIASNNFDTNDNFLFTNFQIDFDWIEIDPNNLNHYISNMENKEIIPLKLIILYLSSTCPFGLITPINFIKKDID